MKQGLLADTFWVAVTIVFGVLFIISCNSPSLYPPWTDLGACVQSSAELHKNCKDFDSQDAKLCNDLYIGSIDVCMRLYREEAIKRLAVDGGQPPAEAAP